MMRELSRQYPVWLSDVWGVVHNGRHAVHSTIEVMKKHRANGGLVVLITNAPRPYDRVIAQMDRLGVDRAAYDAVVTSGDVTRDLIDKHGGGAVYYIGTDAEMSLFQDKDVKLVEADKAKAIVCAGLRNDALESPDQYHDELTLLLKRKLPMICANPDIVVRIGDQLRYCGGAIAADYEKMGGQVLLAGKPHPPIYELAMETVNRLKGMPVSRDDIMVIGDGPDTDIKGAMAQSLPATFLVAGILEGQSTEVAIADITARYPSAQLVHTTTELQW